MRDSDWGTLPISRPPIFQALAVAAAQKQHATTENAAPAVGAASTGSAGVSSTTGTATATATAAAAAAAVTAAGTGGGAATPLARNHFPNGAGRPDGELSSSFISTSSAPPAQPTEVPSVGMLVGAAAAAGGEATVGVVVGMRRSAVKGARVLGSCCVFVCRAEGKSHAVCAATVSREGD